MREFPGSGDLHTRLLIGSGSNPNIKVVNKFGSNPDVDQFASEDVWNAGGTRTFLSAAETMTLVSDDATDDEGSTGAEKVVIEGLDSNYLEISEEVTLNGTSSVTTTNSYFRVLRAYVSQAGSGQTNAGTITIDPTSSGSGSRQAIIAPDDAQTQLAHYTVPANYDAYMVSGQFSAAAGVGTTGVKEVKVRFYIKLPEQNSWRVQGEASTRTDGTSISPNYVGYVPSRIPAKTDLKFEAYSDNNNTEVYVQYCLVLVKRKTTT